jgi:LysM repeat protein
MTSNGLARAAIACLLILLVACGGGEDPDKSTAHRITDPAKVPTSTPIQNAALFQIRGEQVSTKGNPGSVTPVSGSGSPSSRSYTVKSGDTCGAIAGQYGISTEDLLRANRTIDPGCTNLRVGDILRIPSATPAPSGTRSPSSGREYTVQAGDTCSDIAASFGVAVEALISHNNIDRECRDLKVGQVLKIP